MGPDENAPGGEAGGAEDEQPGGRDVVSTVPRRPPAYASLFAPDGRRTYWWFTYRCPFCSGGHFGRASVRPPSPMLRRSGCGHRVLVVVARTYAPEGAQ